MKQICEPIPGTEIPIDTLIDLYRTMRLIRQCEEELARCHQRGLIHGACHTYVGQEAIAAAVCAHLTTEDVVFSTHRGHGHALAKGAHPRELIAELFGRETGLSRGRGGSMHLFSPEIGLMGTSGIVGPSILQACGGGYVFQLLKTGNVAVAFFGDGAVNNGASHEGLNLASIWKLPVLFVCENNQFATEVPFSYACGSSRIGNRGPAYGMISHELDGNDVISIHKTAGEAIDRARAAGGPTLIECKTYRTRAHAEGMGDFTYRSREEVAAWKERCPIERLRQQILRHGIPATELDSVDTQVRSLVDESRRFAESSPWPTPESATQYVHCDDPVLFLEYRELLTLKGPVPENEYRIEFGKAAIVRPGTDVTVMALARMVHPALSVSDELSREGISVELIDPRTVSPLDHGTILQSVHKTGRLLIVDECPGPFGLGAEISARVVTDGFDDFDAPIRRLNEAFAPTPYSPPLESAVGTK